MSKQTIVTAVGLQRSGNHAILDWIGSLFPSHHLFNDLAHDTFENHACLTEMIQSRDEACLIFSFEDSSQNFSRAGTTIVESIAPFPTDSFPGFQVHELIILRDPWNTLASREAARQRFPLTSDPGLDVFIRNWLDLATRQKARPDKAVLFNSWHRDQSYRRMVCDQLNGTYSEVTLDSIPAFGQGSSFDGMQRPTYGQILMNVRKYASREFLSQFAEKPGDYVRRFISPRVSGKQLKVDERWRSLLGNPQFEPIFASGDLKTEAERIFGFSVGTKGDLHSAA